ncbi:hypothetical protein PFISCL1PPCAC_24006, partial [Pristionchus fissidentatus]
GSVPSLSHPSALAANSDDDDIGDSPHDLLAANDLHPHRFTEGTAESLSAILSDHRSMAGLEKLITDSYKFLRMSDDMHEVAQYLNDIRICFIVVTVTCYIFIFIYLIMLCVRRNRRNAPRRRNWDGYQVGKVGDGNFSAATSNNEELTSVRTETVAPYMRNHHGRMGADRNPPSFMRHGHLNHSQTTRLISEQDGSVVKHQIPHITTEPPPPNDKVPHAIVPQLVKDSAAPEISVS